MILLPAIDLIDGVCVRLTRGDYATSAKVADDPVETAKSFEAMGAEWLHVVDLDGAKAGAPVNVDVIEKVRRATGLRIEVGGGVRTLNAVKRYIDLGLDRVILGSAAINDPELVREAVDSYGGAIAVGIDAKNGRVRAGGWLEDGGTDYLKLAAAVDGAGVSTIIYTDISKDGMLAGPNLGELSLINDKVGADVIASGGVRDLGDIRDLMNIGVSGAICGKSVYAGTLDLAAAIRLSGAGPVTANSTK
ncbi:MAG: 1-(5-phosphoribosyl)-5-[(5-phosphoribosylamino)methylideneamino]imidazole-4-carboxamide isomerase [Clostridiales Family XIII bacterium]|jgi:phosphoribosylformimino-5-aminoimidazole carboxamide ribotide isomerase|nr:1-(5-phosphoribosyl)-5-[(5-phosphoribosylamino)methylideneamino]imidazole-4-carboxamide isomerase [Clostridiales Family XIII bacterium]